MSDSCMNIPSHDHSDTAASEARFIRRTPVAFLIGVLIIMPLVLESGSFNSLGIVFVSIILEAIPFMLAGSLIGGLIEAFISRERMGSLLPQKEWLSVFFAAAMGICLPVCECAVVPVVRRLVGKGLPLSAAVSYLLGGPIVNPIVAASTTLAYAFDLPIVILRLVLGYLIAVIIGLAMGWLFDRSSAITPITNHTGTLHCSCGHHNLPPTQTNENIMPSVSPFPESPEALLPGCACAACHPTALALPKDNWISKLKSALRHAVDDFSAVGHYLVIGAFIAALAQTYIDRAAFLNFIGSPVISIVLMMILAVSLNLCSEADAFIAASFRGLVPIPAQMAFMLTGPMFDLKLLLMYQSLFKRRAIFVLAILVLVVVFFVSLGLKWVAIW